MEEAAWIDTMKMAYKGDLKRLLFIDGLLEIRGTDSIEIVLISGKEPPRRGKASPSKITDHKLLHKRQLIGKEIEISKSRSRIRTHRETTYLMHHRITTKGEESIINDMRCP